MCVPRHSVDAAALEALHGCAGRYTQSLLMERYSGCGEDEDAVSLALSAVTRMIRNHGMDARQLGLLLTSSNSNLDRSKAMKTELMSLLETMGINNVEGVDTLDSGARSLLNLTSWASGRAWDGRWAIGVCVDTAEAPVGAAVPAAAGAVALLVGPGAPL